MERGQLSAALAVLCAVLIAATGVSGYTRSQLADRQAFAERGAGILDDPYVRQVVAEELARRLAARYATGRARVRAVLGAALPRVVESRTFRSAFMQTLRRRHARLSSGGGRFVVDLRPSRETIRRQLAERAPRLAAAVPLADLRLRVRELDPTDLELEAAQRVRDVAQLFWALLTATILCALATAVLARTLRRAALLLCGAVVAAGLLVAALVTLLGGVAVDRAAEDAGAGALERDALAAVWETFTADLRDDALLVALAAAVLGVLATALLRRPRAGADAPAR